jgi:hypothetical protein
MWSPSVPVAPVAPVTPVAPVAPVVPVTKIDDIYYDNDDQYRWAPEAFHHIRPMPMVRVVHVM